MEKRILMSLTVGDKIKIINEVKRKVKRKKGIASEFGITARTLSTILNNKDKILKAVKEALCLPQWKKFKASFNALIILKFLRNSKRDFFCLQRDENFTIRSSSKNKKQLKMADFF